MEEEIKVVIGAGTYNNNPGWIHTQEKDLNLLDENTWNSKFKKNSITAILAEHIWEHLTYEEGIQAAKICFNYLKPGGYIRCAVPDAYFRDKTYQETIQIGGPGPEDHPAFSHKIVYNYKLFSNVFETIGYKVSLLEYFDEQGNFNQNNWDGKDGIIFRSRKYDSRNQGKTIIFPSIIVDAIKVTNV